MRSAAEDASIEETLAKLKQQAADLQSKCEEGGLPRAAAPPGTGLPSSLTLSDPDFMRQLAQLKEDHVSNLRVIERMYNEGQGGGGSALPNYDCDDGGASMLHRRVWFRGTHTPAAGTCLTPWNLGPPRAQEPGPRGGVAPPVLAPPAPASPLASHHLAAPRPQVTPSARTTCSSARRSTRPSRRASSSRSGAGRLPRAIMRAHMTARTKTAPRGPTSRALWMRAFRTTSTRRRRRRRKTCGRLPRHARTSRPGPPQPARVAPEVSTISVGEIGRARAARCTNRRCPPTLTLMSPPPSTG